MPVAPHLDLGEDSLQCSLIGQVHRPQVNKVSHRFEVCFNTWPLGQGSVTSGDNIRLQSPDALQYRMEFGWVY